MFEPCLYTFTFAVLPFIDKYITNGSVNAANCDISISFTTEYVPDIFCSMLTF
ncbi:hypothetical protein D1T48_gp35 [Thermoproteus tenax virus 1]|uniref:Uncharacterized 5.9 kDa protein n=1 Tax=Thermoproteus tenax virus 1 (strain KRA1) TaxID=10480 RepID=YORV_TTV1K|nr:hypothetical protein D1T48_gp35 [Thermoproteus tenax virus 1]P19306.1 RecName: Full=Uncharacterized 5.9 kDa protein [Thermoproteus tenax virus 1 (STRAIN KRA1)]CAA32839.1 unnamed protein product [Thermoproteus tenax virus 1]CAA33003.1 unnamed protein product [Thermoproteus tenax virus 1]